VFSLNNIQSQVFCEKTALKWMSLDEKALLYKKKGNQPKKSSSFKQNQTSNVRFIKKSLPEEVCDHATKLARQMTPNSFLTD